MLIGPEYIFPLGAPRRRKLLRAPGPVTKAEVAPSVNLDTPACMMAPVPAPSTPGPTPTPARDPAPAPAPEDLLAEVERRPDPEPRQFEEMKDVAQKEEGVWRQWFCSDWAELIVWWHAEDHRRMIGFQLCYSGCALTWTADKGCSHHRVDDGEDGFKASPVLVAGARFDAAAVARSFERSSLSLDPGLADFVHEKLAAYHG